MHHFFFYFFSGLIAVICGIVVLIMDFVYPIEIASFFGVDPLQDFEDTFVYDDKSSNGLGSAVCGSFLILFSFLA